LELDLTRASKRVAKIKEAERARRVREILFGKRKTFIANKDKPEYFPSRTINFDASPNPFRGQDAKKHTSSGLLTTIMEGFPLNK
jgi:hypothetical protein